ncbi:MAG: hypothetical protein ACPGJV_15625 [Bacteriovoracaceae bacterium]
MRILITGNSGSGKSSFGKRLSLKLNIPLYGLDQIVWKSNWVKVSKEEKEKKIKEITSHKSWIIEGVSKQAMNKADTVVFLDLPKHKCISNIIKRFLKNGVGTRKELPSNCPDYIGVLKAIKIALIFNKVTRPWIMEESRADNFIQVKNHEELGGLLIYISEMNCIQ